jgi:lysozyme family protein
MFSSFDEAVKTVLKHEGGYVNDPHDPGGATNYGISLRFLKATGDLEVGDVDHDGDIDQKDIACMTPAEAERIYRKYWWDRYDYEAVPDQEVATKIFDMAVNMGPAEAHRIVQRAVNAVASATLAVDGIFGPGTREALSEAIERFGGERVLAALRERQKDFYVDLVARKPDLGRYLAGWLTRAAE